MPPRVAEQLTVLLTTSPTHTNPSTDVIEMVLDSMKLVDSLQEAPLVVVCDGASIKASNNFRQGAIREEHVDKYEEYKSRLRSAAAASTSGVGVLGGARVLELEGRHGFAHAVSTSGVAVLAGARVLELEGRHGFAHAVRRGLELVATPYVMVLQHDRNFRRGFDLGGVLSALEAHPEDVHYVGLPSASHTSDYAHFVASKYRELRVGQREAGGVSLLTQVQYIDSTHVGRTAWYRDFVFRPGGLFVTASGQMKKSMFIEDRLGQEMLADLREHGIPEAHRRWGCWLLDECTGGPVVQHINAHDSRVLVPGQRQRYGGGGAEGWRGGEPGVAT